MSTETEFQPFPKMPRLSRDIVITEKLDGTNAQILIVPYVVSLAEQANGSALGDLHNLDPAATSQDGFIVLAGSRNRWLTPQNDNYGFARWALENRAELLKLGPGRHFGEWWGAGIQRRYNISEKRFSLFNVGRWFPNSMVSPVELTEENVKGPLIVGRPAPVDRPGVCFQVDESTAQVGPACCHVVPVLYRGPFDEAQINTALGRLEMTGSVAAPGFMDPEGIVIYHEASKQCFKKTIKDDGKPKGTNENQV